VPLDTVVRLRTDSEAYRHPFSSSELGGLIESVAA